MLTATYGLTGIDCGTAITTSHLDEIEKIAKYFTVIALLPLAALSTLGHAIAILASNRLR
mgnify:CR=1 FL=1